MNKSNFKTKIPAILIMYFAAAMVLAQPTQQWAARYNGPANSVDVATSIKVDGQGNVYITGRSYAGGGLGYDYATVKYNSSGLQMWSARYNGPGNNEDHANSMVIDASGNVYVTGASTGNGTSQDYATIKYNSSGVQQWVARYNGPGNNTDGAIEIVIDGSNNIYVTGGSQGSGTSSDYATIKYSSAGVQQWVARYHGPDDFDQAVSLAVDGSGNVYVTGMSDGGSPTFNDYATIKYNSAGVQQWVRRYNGTGSSGDAAYSIAVDASGNIYVTGSSSGTGTASDYATVKYNSSGTQLWAARYNGPGNSNDQAFKIVLVGTSIYVTGASTGTSNGDFATIKYNSSGVQQWAARYNGPPGNLGDGANDMTVDGSGNIYVTGYSTGSSTSNDYATIKYNPSGVQQWVLKYNGSGNSTDEANAIAVDGSGNIYVTGNSIASNPASDYATIKYREEALPVEIAYFNSFVNRNDVSLSWGTVWELNNSGFRIERKSEKESNWKEAGFVQGYGSVNEEKHYVFRDINLIKGKYQYRLQQIDYNGNFEYHSLPGEVTIGSPGKFEISQNYPNPSNPKSKIDFNLPFDAQVTLKVYDITGKEAAVLVNSFLESDYHSAEFDGSNLASGVYFYRITAEGIGQNFSKTLKMILVK